MQKAAMLLNLYGHQAVRRKLKKGVKHISLFESAILNFFASSLFKSVTIYVIPRMGRNFDDYLDFKQKARGMKTLYKAS